MTVSLPPTSATAPASTQPILAQPASREPAPPPALSPPVENLPCVMPIQSPFRNWSDIASFVVFWIGHLVSMIYFKLSCLGKGADEIATTFRNTVITPQIATILTAPIDQVEAAERRTYDLACDLTWLTYSSISQMNLVPVMYQDEAKKQKLLQVIETALTITHVTLQITALERLKEQVLRYQIQPHANGSASASPHASANTSASASSHTHANSGSTAAINDVNSVSTGTHSTAATSSSAAANSTATSSSLPSASSSHSGSHPGLQVSLSPTPPNSPTAQSIETEIDQLPTPEQRRDENCHNTIVFAHDDRLLASDYTSNLADDPKVMKDSTNVNLLAARLEKFAARNVIDLCNDLNIWQIFNLIEALILNSKHEVLLTQQLVQKFKTSSPHTKALFSTYLTRYENDLVVSDRYKVLSRATAQTIASQQRQASHLAAATAAAGSANTAAATAPALAPVITSTAPVTSSSSSSSATAINLSSSSQNSDAIGAVSSGAHASASATVAAVLPLAAAPLPAAPLANASQASASTTSASSSSSVAANLPALPVAPQVASPAERLANDKGGSVGFRNIDRVSANDFLAVLENVPDEMVDYSIIKALAARLDYPAKSVKAAFIQLTHWQQLFLFEAASAKRQQLLIECIARSYAAIEEAQEKTLFKSYLEQYQNDAAVGARYKLILAAIAAPRAS